MVNPFRPTFGSAPHILVGREHILEDFQEAFAYPDPGAPGLTTLIAGARGMGKTVLLSEYARTAREQGWLVVQETARPGLVQRLAEHHLPSLLQEWSTPSRLAGAGFSMAGFGANATWKEAEGAPVPTLRSQVERLCDLLAPHETGLAIVVDEVQQGDAGELQELGEIAQFARMSDRLFGLAAAGLANYMDEFLAGRGTTFLRRAERHDIGAIENEDALAEAFAETFRDAGRTISEDAARTAAEACGGYPFLFQLIGYMVWRNGSPDAVVESADIPAAVSASLRRMGSLVHSSALEGLSEVDKRYLRMMSMDPVDSSTSEIAERMGATAGYANMYRTRLIRQGLIEPSQYGRVRYTIPGLGEYLREHSEESAPPRSAGPKRAR